MATHENSFDPENHKLTPHIRSVVVWPHPGLTEECPDVCEFDENIKQFALDMFATMEQHGGVGIAAPQVGITANIIAIRVEHEKPFIMINPTIDITGEDSFEMEEGCLSVPGYFEKRSRPSRIIVNWQDLDGNGQNGVFDNIYAFAIQHEIDHLKGKTFVDRLSMFKKQRVKTKIKKYKREHSKLSFAN